jgi:hypothetical protein
MAHAIDRAILGEDADVDSGLYNLGSSSVHKVREKRR